MKNITIKAEHTPGPWRQGTPGGKAMDTVFTHDGGSIVCEVNTSAPEPGEREANARLIAAAPELLGVCKDILKFIIRSRPQTLMESQNKDAARRILVLAIAKTKPA